MKNKYAAKKNKVTFVDLFSGIGGFHLGLTKAAKKKHASVECVLAVDIDSKAQLTYSLNFKNTKILGDIKDPNVRNNIPKYIDIICGGFPCQPFSVAGKKKGMEDHRGTLFTYIVQILHDKKPKAVFLENVMNLMNIMNGDERKLIDFIKEEMAKVGYPVSIHTYKASEFGLPTNRPRLYIVGFRKDILPSAPDEDWWPKIKFKNPVTLAEYFSNLGSKWDKREISREGWPSRVGRTIRLGGVGSAFKSMNWLKKQNPPPSYYIKINENKIWVNDKRTWDSYLFYEDDIKKMVPHTLTVDEAKAMMGFQSNFEFPENLSSNQKMKQIGNSVAIPVIEAISLEIINTINKSK